MSLEIISLIISELLKLCFLQCKHKLITLGCVDETNFELCTMIICRIQMAANISSTVPLEVLTLNRPRMIGVGSFHPFFAFACLLLPAHGHIKNGLD